MTSDALNAVLAQLDAGAMCVGAVDAGEDVYIELKHARRGTDALLLLKMLWVPGAMRRQGVCRRIVDALERRADRERRLLAIGPITADENDNSFLGDLCVRRGYSPCPPWTYIRERPEPACGDRVN